MQGYYKGEQKASENLQKRPHLENSDQTKKMKTLSPLHRTLLLDCCIFFLANRKVSFITKKMYNVNPSTLKKINTLTHSQGSGFPDLCYKGQCVSYGCFSMINSGASGVQALFSCRLFVSLCQPLGIMWTIAFQMANLIPGSP